MNLCEWLTLRQVSNGGNNEKDKTRKKIKRGKEKKIIIKEKKRKGNEKSQKEGNGKKTGEQTE